MNLDERKLKILQAIIKNYLETGEPVGSRTISKYTDLNLSSATIRNEMADLEDMGYIMQPHTSAGRIPSDKGYRLYVDSMLEHKNKEYESMKAQLIEKTDKFERILENVVKVLAQNTNYATLATTHSKKRRSIKFIQLTVMEDSQILLVVVMDGNLVKNKIIKTPYCCDTQTILKLNLVFNSYLQGLNLDSISMSVMQNMKIQAGAYEEIVTLILDEIALILKEQDNPQIFTSGATNILKYPELNTNASASQILGSFEEKTMLSHLISDKLGENENRDIQVYIGNETEVESMKDCSLVTATYEIEEGVFGKVGIIGPKRMDYDKVVSTLENLMDELDTIFKKDGKVD